MTVIDASSLASYLLQLHDGAQKIEKYIAVHQGLIIATYNIKIYV